MVVYLTIAKKFAIKFKRFSSFETTMASQYAFLVGINEYAAPSINDLSGCVNDVADMADTLVACGFPSENIVIRTDSRATKEAILNGLQWLISDTQEGDVLVFYYSGHGSQVPTRDSEGELDGKDEIICPHDMSFGDEIYISDNDIRDIIAGLPDGRYLELIFDSCHSGTVTRAIIASTENLAPTENLMLKNIVSKRRSRYLPPPLDYNFHIQHNPKLPTQRFLKNTQLEKKKGTKGTQSREVIVVTDLNHILWAGCRDDQESQETTLGGTERGAFTYYFCKEIRASNGQITRRNLDGLLSSNLNSQGFMQIPQLESRDSDLDKRLFGLE